MRNLEWSSLDVVTTETQKAQVEAGRLVLGLSVSVKRSAKDHTSNDKRNDKQVMFGFVRNVANDARLLYAGQYQITIPGLKKKWPMDINIHRPI